MIVQKICKTLILELEEFVLFLVWEDQVGKFQTEKGHQNIIQNESTFHKVKYEFEPFLAPRARSQRQKMKKTEADLFQSTNKLNRSTC